MTLECSDYHHIATSTRCSFIRNTSDCDIDEGFINYIETVYCHFSSVPSVGIILLVFWWLLLFLTLAVTADDFFCPALAVVSKTLKLSHNIAGVTFLAFGNGAPDIFSAIAAVGNLKNGNAGLALGALIGAGVFVTTVVPGTIVLVQPFQAMSRPFLRDITFYIVAVFFTFVVLYDHRITTAEAVGFIILYVVYVIVVVLSRYIRQRSLQSERDANTRKLEQDKLVEEEASYDRTAAKRLAESDSINNDDREATPLLSPGERRQISELRELLNALNPISEEFKEMRVYAKAYEIIKSPVIVLLRLTIPVVDESAQMSGWCHPLAVINGFTGPLFASLATKGGLKVIGSYFPVWALMMIIGISLGVTIFLTSKRTVIPVYHNGFAFAGFVVAVIWIYSIANEIVNILQMFGVVFKISNAVLGLTLLAWGNSIGDLVADTTMAKQGFPRMGISACFGGPLFNLLLGIGIPFTLGAIKHGGHVKLAFDTQQAVILGFLLLSLCFSLVALVIQRFWLRRVYGVCLLVIYVLFLISALLTEANVIPNSAI